MKPEMAYIIRTDDPRSMRYSVDMSNACDAIGMPWQYLDWYQGKADESWNNTGVARPPKTSNGQPAQCCYSGHLACWKKILDSGKPGIILEHDGKMLHKVNIDIPDNAIVVLGYKIKNPDAYDHVAAGPPKEILDIPRHEGSHAYAITPATAKKLIDRLLKQGQTRPIDNDLFLKSRDKSIPIKIMSPTPAIGWIRESTIQGKSSTRNYEFISSFKENLDQKTMNDPK